MDILMVLMGWLAHHLKVLNDIKTGTGELWLPHQYIRNRPYSFLLSIVGTVMGSVFAMALLNPATQTMVQDPQLAQAIYLGTLAGVGVMGDLVADKFSSFAAKRFL